MCICGNPDEYQRARGSGPRTARLIPRPRSRTLTDASLAPGFVPLPAVVAPISQRSSPRPAALLPLQTRQEALQRPPVHPSRTLTDAFLTLQNFDFKPSRPVPWPLEPFGASKTGILVDLGTKKPHTSAGLPAFGGYEIASLAGRFTTATPEMASSEGPMSVITLMTGAEGAAPASRHHVPEGQRGVPMTRPRATMAPPTDRSELLFWGAAIAIFIFSGFVVIYMTHFHIAFGHGIMLSA